MQRYVSYALAGDTEDLGSTTSARLELMVNMAAFQGRLDFDALCERLRLILRLVDEVVPTNRATIVVEDEIFYDDTSGEKNGAITVEWQENGVCFQICTGGVTAPHTVRVRQFTSTDEPLHLNSAQRKSHYEETHHHDEQHALPLGLLAAEDIGFQVARFLSQAVQPSEA